eukprot:1160456-Pelagomonas_calceolata.AAC.3
MIPLPPPPCLHPPTTHHPISPSSSSLILSSSSHHAPVMIPLPPPPCFHSPTTAAGAAAAHGYAAWVGERWVAHRGQGDKHVHGMDDLQTMCTGNA